MPLSNSEAKVLSMVIIGAGSFLIGLLPACFTNRKGGRKLLLSSLLCFGAGVLLATSLLHMLPETREAIPQYAELTVCCGFLLLYMVDEIVHFIWGDTLDVTPEQDQSSHRHSHQSSHHEPVTHGYGHSHIAIEKSPERDHHEISFQVKCQVPTPNVARRASYGGILDQTNLEPNLKNTVNYVQNRSHSCYGSIPVIQPPVANAIFGGEEDGTLLCHGSHSEPCANTNASLLGLLIALTLHAVLEGLAVGLEAEASKVLLLVTAIASHKLVVGFCLGIELAAASDSFLRHAIAIGVFAGGSSAGIGIGMFVTEIEQTWVTSILMPVLQGVAGGSLLYVTVSEVLPRERARWHNKTRRAAGITQFFSVTCGFFFMHVLDQYIGHHH